jgi:hypothetical protein
MYTGRCAIAYIARDESGVSDASLTIAIAFSSLCNIVGIFQWSHANGSYLHACHSFGAKFEKSFEILNFPRKN